MKKTKISPSHMVISVCVVAAAALLCFLFNDIARAFGGTSGQGTVFEFKAESNGNIGFSREAIVYTEDGTTNVILSGDITTDGTAVIALLSDDGTTTIFSKAYTAVTSEEIKIDIVGLTPDTYYILRFSSDDAKKGHLTLTTEQALVERPEVPERAVRTVPER